jgi:hypothetical protein
VATWVASRRHARYLLWMLNMFASVERDLLPRF